MWWHWWRTKVRALSWSNFFVWRVRQNPIYSNIEGEKCYYKRVMLKNNGGSSSKHGISGTNVLLISLLCIPLMHRFNCTSTRGSDSRISDVWSYNSGRKSGKGLDFLLDQVSIEQYIHLGFSRFFFTVFSGGDSFFRNCNQSTIPNTRDYYWYKFNQQLSIWIPEESNNS